MLSLTWHTTTAQQMPAGSTDALGILARSHTKHTGAVASSTAAETRPHAHTLACITTCLHILSGSDSSLQGDYEALSCFVFGPVKLQRANGWQVKISGFWDEINPLDWKKKKKNALHRMKPMLLPLKRNIELSGGILLLLFTDIITQLPKCILNGNRVNNACFLDGHMQNLSFYTMRFEWADSTKPSSNIKTHDNVCAS